MNSKLIYRLKSDPTAMLHKDLEQFQSQCRCRQFDQLSRLSKVRHIREGFNAEIEGQSVIIRSVWLANALIVDSTPEVHLTLQAGLDLIDMHPDYEYFLVDFGVNDIRRNATLKDGIAVPSRWHHELLELEEVKAAYGLTGLGTRIGVLDTGISPSQGTVAKLLKFAFVDQNAQLHLDQVPSEPASLSHGTHVSGSIVDDTYGLAPGARILLASVNNGVYSFSKWSQINTGLEWLLSEGVHAINMSLGGPGYRNDLDEQLGVCRQRGVAVFAAIGNVLPGNTLYPGNSALTISVGAMAKGGELIVRSGSDGDKPDFVAAGEDIISTLRDGQFGAMSGTSQATPQATGIFSLLKEYRPQATTDQLVESMRRTAVPLPRVPSDRQGDGLLSLKASLQYLESLPPDGAMPQEVRREQYTNIDSIQVDLNAALVQIVADRTDDLVVVEVTDANSPIVRGINFRVREGTLVLYPTPSHVGSSLVVTISSPPLETLGIGLKSGSITVKGKSNALRISTVSADVMIGILGTLFSTTRCGVETISGRIEARIPNLLHCNVFYSTLSGKVILQSSNGVGTAYAGSGSLGNDTSGVNYTLQTVSREIVITTD